jgi:hypothetical protein
MSVEAEQVGYTEETDRLVKAENEKLSEEESRLEGLKGAIELATSDVERERLQAIIDEKLMSFMEAAVLVDEEAKLHEKLIQSQAALRDSIASLEEIRTQIRAIVYQATMRQVQIAGGSGMAITGSGAGGGVTSYELRQIIEEAKSAPSIEQCIERCREQAEGLRHYDPSLFREFEQIQELDSDLGSDDHSIPEEAA